MPRIAAQELPPTWVTKAVGSVREAERIRWGFTNESWRVTTKHGRSLVVTRMADQAAAKKAVEHGPAIGAALALVGISIPVPVPEPSAPEQAAIVSAFIPGRSGMELMGDPEGAASVGRVIGEAWLALGRVETAGLDLDDLWARPNDLAAVVQASLQALDPTMDPAVAHEISGRIEELPQLLAGRPSGFVHGDLVPANVLVDDGGLAALLDLETVRVGERLLDAAWFRWIVRYHHPDVARPAWRGFAEAGGLNDLDPTAGPLLEILPIVRILEILSKPTLGAGPRERWLDQLRALGASNGDRPAP
jgi:Ser/Thr protein kinase RdoA (MazF antagonist)